VLTGKGINHISITRCQLQSEQPACGRSRFALLHCFCRTVCGCSRTSPDLAFPSRSILKNKALHWPFGKVSSPLSAHGGPAPGVEHSPAFPMPALNERLAAAGLGAGTAARGALSVRRAPRLSSPQAPAHRRSRRPPQPSRPGAIPSPRAEPSPPEAATTALGGAAR